MIEPVDVEAVASFTDKIEPLVKKMADASNGRYTPDYLFGALASGDLWVASIDGWRAAALFKAINHPTGLNELEIVCLAGEGLKEWAYAVVDLERIARSMHFNRLSAPIARKGWVPFALKHGWREASVRLEKDLPHG